MRGRNDRSHRGVTGGGGQVTFVPGYLAVYDYDGAPNNFTGSHTLRLVVNGVEFRDYTFTTSANWEEDASEGDILKGASFADTLTNLIHGLNADKASYGTLHRCSTPSGYGVAGITPPTAVLDPVVVGSGAYIPRITVSTTISASIVAAAPSGVAVRSLSAVLQ